MEKSVKTYYVAKYMNKYLNLKNYPSLEEDRGKATMASTCDEIMELVHYQREALKENKWFIADIEIVEVVKTVTVTEEVVFNKKNGSSTC